MNNFDLQLQRGKECEQLIAPLIMGLNCGSGLHFSQGKNSDYDFAYEINGSGISYELKTDYKAAQTRNVFVETGNGTKDTGIKVSKADRVIYYFPGDNLVTSCTPQKLLTFIESNPTFRKITGAGDGNACGVLIPILLFTGAAPKSNQLNPKLLFLN